uniref:Uncharacterized protein n=1 Tax=Anguilla anguilla TaxID=7936 RepID=A0A0E9VK30_ANGAN
MLFVKYKIWGHICIGLTMETVGF